MRCPPRVGPGKIPLLSRLACLATQDDQICLNPVLPGDPGEIIPLPESELPERRNAACIVTENKGQRCHPIQGRSLLNRVPEEGPADFLTPVI
jgi:hypothetical protein